MGWSKRGIDLLTLGTKSVLRTYVVIKSLLLAAMPSLKSPPGGAKQIQRRSGYWLRNITGEESYEICEQKMSRRVRENRNGKKNTS